VPVIGCSSSIVESSALGIETVVFARNDAICTCSTKNLLKNKDLYLQAKYSSLWQVQNQDFPGRSTERNPHNFPQAWAGISRIFLLPNSTAKSARWQRIFLTKK
jgi:hypothetical protein